MKRLVPLFLLCVIFVLSTNIGVVYAFQPEHIDFVYGNKTFTYSLENNIKTSKIFNVEHEINKYNRFGATNERINLLKRILSIGIDKQVAIEYLFPNINNKIDSISKNIFIPTKNATCNINTNTSEVFKYSNECIGRVLDKQKLIENICNNYLNQKEMKFSLPIIEIKPTITVKDLKLDKYLRADFCTDISKSSLDRKHNIKNSLNSINKVEILPNEVFSFNKTVGRRTAENGYRQAKIIVNNEFVDGLGGGVCQVSSTLYNAALLAGLEIVEANKHSKQVSYVSKGFDAMVNFGSSDLKFRNNTSQKITIITNYTTNKARVRIFGESMGLTKFKLSNEVLNIVQPKEEVFVDENGDYVDKVVYSDEYFYQKNGCIGMEIKTYREKFEDNILISKELLRHDKYKVQNAVKIYGNKQRILNTI